MTTLYTLVGRNANPDFPHPTPGAMLEERAHPTADAKLEERAPQGSNIPVITTDMGGPAPPPPAVRWYAGCPYCGPEGPELAWDCSCSVNCRAPGVFCALPPLIS